MASGRYTIGRIALLQWINSFTGLGLSKIEESANGVVACHVFDALYPDTLRMDKVKFGARRDYEFIENYKILQEAFTVLEVKRSIPVERLTRGKYQDNFEFMQWVKGYFDEHANEDSDAYDARAVRQQHSKSTGTTRSKSASDRPRTQTSRVRTGATKPTPRTANHTEKPSARSTATSRARATTSKASTRAAPPPARARRVPEKTRTAAPKVEMVPKTEADGLRAEIAELDKLLEQGDMEREFYYQKLRDIEGILQDVDDQYRPDELDSVTIQVVDLVRQVLYADGESTPQGADENKGPLDLVHNLQDKLQLGTEQSSAPQ